MKATYKGISHHRIEQGKAYEVVVHENTVECKGKGFEYSFTYSSEEKMKSDWKFEGR